MSLFVRASKLGLADELILHPDCKFRFLALAMFHGVSTLRKKEREQAPPSQKNQELQDYLKKYTGEATPKKKRRKKKSSGAANLQIVDKDVTGFAEKRSRKQLVEAEVDEEEDAPVVANAEEVEIFKRQVEKAKKYYGDDGWTVVEEAQPQSQGQLSGNKSRLDSPDQSPPRRIRHDSPDQSPQRRSRHDSPDQSPPRRKRHDSPDQSPPRRNRQDSSDQSPPRRKRHDSPDQSPQRRTRHDSPDQSPPRRKRHDSPDQSPPRRHRQDSSDQSPPRRKRHVSPDQSPARKQKQPSKHLSPQRRLNSGSPDLSPPRRTRNDSPDLSPPRRIQRNDLEGAGSKRYQHGSPQSTRNKGHGNHRGEKRLATGNERSMDKDRRRRMADGAAAGVVSGSQLKLELEKKRELDKERLDGVDQTVLGAGAETVYRDKKDGKRVSLEDLEKEKAKKKVKWEKVEWASGLAQQKQSERYQEEMLKEAAKPFARSRDDHELESMLKARTRFGDPMAHLVKRKQPSELNPAPVINDSNRAMFSKSGYIVPQEVPPHSWLKRRVPAAINRYGIRPGRHWDGVDRSNGFEKEFMLFHNEKVAREKEAMMWSQEDM